MADGTIDIELHIDDGAALSQADQIGNKIGSRVDSQVKQATRNTSQSTTQAINEIGQSVTNYGMAYTKAVTAPILAAGAASGAAAVKIDTALTGVRKTVDGTEQQYKALKDAAIEFSQTNAVDPAQILDIQALGAQLGYSIDELQMFGEVVSGLDIATNMNADEAATELAQFANIMGMAHSETKNYGSTIVELGNNFATTEADISHMAMRIAGAGKQIGLTEADVLGLATALSSMGIEAEAGGTAISTIMANIDKEVATNGKNLETWAKTANMSVDEFVNAWGTDAVGALSAVLVGMNSATEAGGNMSVMLDELGITSIRQTDTFKRLASNSEFLGKAVRTANDAWRENTALDKEVENRNNSMAAQFQILMNRVQAVAIEVGEPLMKALIDVIDAADPLIEALASGAKAFSDLDEGGQRTILMAVAAIAAFGPLTAGIGKITTSVTGAVSGWKRFSESMKIVRSGLAQSNAAAATATANFGKYFSVIRNGQTEVYKVNRTTGTYQKTNSALAKVLATTTVGVKAQNAAIKAGTVVLNAAKGAAAAFGAALKSIAPMAIIAGIVQLADAIGHANDEASTMKKATDGLTGSMKSYSDAYQKTIGDLNSASESATHYSASLKSVSEKTAEAVQHQAELSDKLNETWSNVGTDAAMIDVYTDTIKRLTAGYDENGNAVKLTAQQQAQLQTAVSGLNEIMGTNISVIDGENGVLSESTSVILASANAWKERALAEAASMAQSELMKQHIENLTAMSEAERLVNQEQQNLNQATNDFESAMYAQRLRDAEGALSDLQSQDRSVTDEMDKMQSVVQQLSEAYSSSTDSISNYTDSTEQWKSALSSAGVDVSSFSETLSQLGISANDLSEILRTQGEEGIQGFIEAYQNGKDALLEWVSSAIPEIGDAIAETTSANTETVTAATQDMFDAQNQTITAAAEANSQAAADTANQTAESYIQTTDSRAGDVAAATESMITTANSNAASQASNEGQQVGAAEGEGVASGIESSGGQVNSSVQSIVSEAANTAQNGAEQFMNAGTKSGDSYSQGINQGVSKAGNAGRQIASAAAKGMTSGVNEARKIGRNTAEAYVSQISAATGSAQQAAQGIKNAVIEELRSAESEAYNAGQMAGQGFINGMDSTLSGAVAKAREIARAAIEAMKQEGQQGSPWRTTIQVGKFAGEGLVVGLNKMIGAVEKAGANLSSKLLGSMQELNEFDQNIVWEKSGLFGGKMVAKGLVVGFEDYDPMSQLTESIEKGLSAITIAAAAKSSGGDVYNSTNNQTNNFYSPVQTPDEFARQMRLQNNYGLAGRR